LGTKTVGLNLQGTIVQTFLETLDIPNFTNLPVEAKRAAVKEKLILFIMKDIFDKSLMRPWMTIIMQPNRGLRGDPHSKGNLMLSQYDSVFRNFWNGPTSESTITQSHNGRYIDIMNGVILSYAYWADTNSLLRLPPENNEYGNYKSWHAVQPPAPMPNPSMVNPQVHAALVINKNYARKFRVGILLGRDIFSFPHDVLRLWVQSGKPTDSNLNQVIAASVKSAVVEHAPRLGLDFIAEYKDDLLSSLAVPLPNMDIRKVVTAAKQYERSPAVRKQLLNYT
jgi:hypothetical protein